MHNRATGVLKPAHTSSGELSGHLSSRFWVQGHQACSLKLDMGSICTTEISKCYKARLLFYPAPLEGPWSHISHINAHLQWKPSLSHLSLNIATSKRATDSCDLVTNSWNLRTGEDLKGYLIVVSLLSLCLWILPFPSPSVWHKQHPPSSSSMRPYHSCVFASHYCLVLIFEDSLQYDNYTHKLINQLILFKKALKCSVSQWTQVSFLDLLWHFNLNTQIPWPVPGHKTPQAVLTSAHISNWLNFLSSSLTLKDFPFWWAPLGTSLTF